MRYVIAIFCPPLAVLMCGAVVGALVSLLIWVGALVATLVAFVSVGSHTFLAFAVFALIGSVPMMVSFWLLALVHAGMHIENHYKRERITEMNMHLRASGHTMVPLPPKPEIFDYLFLVAAVGLVGWSVITGRARDESEAAKAAHVESVTSETALALPPPLPILDGWTLPEVEGRHGAPITRDARTAWAEWPRFRAHFTNGVVDEVQPR